MFQRLDTAILAQQPKTSNLSISGTDMPRSWTDEEVVAVVNAIRDDPSLYKEYVDVHRANEFISDELADRVTRVMRARHPQANPREISKLVFLARQKIKKIEDICPPELNISGYNSNARAEPASGGRD